MKVWLCKEFVAWEGDFIIKIVSSQEKADKWLEEQEKPLMGTYYAIQEEEVE